MAIEHRSNPFSPPVLTAIALAVGLMIALADSSPGWDSTGITAGALVLGGGTTAYVGRTRPWLWTLLVGAPTPIIEIAGSRRDGLAAGARVRERRRHRSAGRSLAP